MNEEIILDHNFIWMTLMLLNGLYMANKILKLGIENEALKDCVEFYASPRNYNFEGGFIEDDNSLISYTDHESLDDTLWVEGRYTKYPYEDFIGGKLARQTLKDISKQ